MRQRPLSLLFALSLLAPALHAQEEPIEPPTTVTEPTDSIEFEALEVEAEPQLAGLAGDTTEALLLRLREENRRLRLQLQTEQAKVLPAMLSEQQQWFAVGGAVGVISFTLGLLVTRGRRRRQWLN
ncbi:hypothetical protein CXK91_20910 [Stutzerimonas stutzeri]|uniref:Translation initiation factor 2 (IF-2, GTPase) n=1 Tax=Stutzerimonas stutzeri TaxID=316 RepID=A0A2S4AIJ3_STUST|nr:hypothetical protein [Stutzerimonas stutzeri]MCQ4264183.1 hypothetical protein [Stutzerimonas stutzeri]POH81062.1 hypothetical protein CXK91_20910 [Stutzerimonas stutzeri]